MKVERWERTKQILEDALRLAPEERSAFLDSACGADDDLRAEVESLIASHEQAGSNFLAAPAAKLLHLALAFDTSGRPPLTAIGPYRLIEQIGRGGMGQVWLAEQTAPVRRRVALKLIKAGMFDDQLLKRFELERQSLAMMDHPNIAKVFDAGATPDGQPYFVMEYVPGLPITDYCDQKRLSVRERLELFIKVCEAVQHAHQKAILHRDLKPANILVQEIDGNPVPRIIDFGLAKAITPGLGGDSVYTQLGSFVGTPGYMSPEQCDQSSPDVDTRSDVYSLGVVLYVLLTGCLPFQQGTGTQAGLEDMLRLVREEDPPRPSTKVSRNREASSATAAARATQPKQLVSALRGDLDWVTMKALEKVPARRYGTASELAADIAHYLKHEPVTARPAGLSYRMGKYARRHRVAVSVAAGLLIMLAGFAVMQSLQLRRIRRERDRADRIAQFMTGMFNLSNPNQALGDTLTARDVLDNAAKRVDSGLSNDPVLQARMMHILGRAYLNLDLYQKAQALFERGIRVGTAAAGPNDRETLRTTHDLAWALQQQRRLAEAESLERKLLDTQQRLFGSDDPDTLATKAELAFTLCEEGNCNEAVRLSREVLEKQKRIFGPEAYFTLLTTDNLAIFLGKDGRPAEAEKLEQESLDIHLRVFGPNDRGTLDALANMADFKRDLGKDTEAEKSLRQALDIAQRTLGPDEPDTAHLTYDLARILVRRGQRDQAFSMLDHALHHGLPAGMAAGLETDPMLAPLHRDPRFAALVADARQRAATNPN